MQKHSPATAKCEIPLILRQSPRWIRWELRTAPNGKPSKVPSVSPKRLDLATTFDERIPRDELGGVGFLFVGGVMFHDKQGTALRLLALDLDACRDPLADEITGWAEEIIVWSGRSYTELSPGGYGLRVLVLVPDATIPAGLRPTARATESAPGTTKQAGLQLFGLGVSPSYVTMTGRRLTDTAASPLVVPDLQWLIDRFALAVRDTTPAVMPEGFGPVPTLDEITEGVLAQRHGRALIEGDWQKVMPTRSGSEAYYMLQCLALRAARNHGTVALDWLMERTAWGRDEVANIKEPGKYARRSWAEKDLARVASKAHPHVDIETAFEVLEETPPPAAAGDEPAAGTPRTMQPAGAPASIAGDPLGVCDQWEQEGPLVHLPTGIPSLDAATGGGLVLGSRVYLVGAPDAGKTALAVQLLDHYLGQGVTVGILAVDEEPSDVVTRLLQRRGLSRVECEQRSPATLARARELLAGAPLRVYGFGLSIEAAAVDLHRVARARNPDDPRPPCVLVLDSIQTVRAENEDPDASMNRLVTGRVAAVRAAASRYRMLVLSTSEMNRAAYKSRKAEENASDMSAAKESGAIEFSARVMLTLRSVPDVPNVVECRVTKNKHGAATRPGDDGMFLRFDRDAQQLTEDGEFRPIGDGSSAADERIEAAARLALLLTQQEGVGRNAAVQHLAGVVPERRVRDARAWLIEVGAIRETVGKQRLRAMELVSTKLPVEVRKRLEELFGE